MPRRAPRPRTVRDLEAADRSGLKSAAKAAGDRLGSAPIATTHDGVLVVILPAHLATGSADGWTLTPWHEVESGAWNSELEELQLTLADRRRIRHRLAEPGLVPEVMRERVASTIVFQRWLEMPETGSGVTVSARRSLVDQAVTWRATPGRGLKPNDPDVMAFGEAAVRRLRTEFGID